MSIERISISNRNIKREAQLHTSRILIFNYAMDENSQVFSHQIEVVNKLSHYFEEVTVLTAHRGIFKVSPNVNVICSNWVEGHKIRNVVKFYSSFFKLIFQRRYQVIFSHMTSVQSFLASPFTRVFGIKHYLWYAHTSDSYLLRFTKLFTNGIITSTYGSCPLKGKKIYAIGQSINSKLFVNKKIDKFNFNNFIHIGRLDPSKNIELIISVASKLKKINPELRLKIVGSPSSKKYISYAQKVINHVKNNPDLNWVTFVGKTPRKEIPNILSQSDCFLHAFQGSLDKSLIEATFVGIPVVTINNEYIKNFGSWSDKYSEDNPSFEEELYSLLNFDKDKLNGELDRRFLVASNQHELSHWIERLLFVLNS